MALRLWLGFPKSLDISKAIDKKLGAERKTVGLKPYTNDGSIRGNSYNKGGYERVQLPITAPATPEAKQWEGWGTALKPANEPIVLARKPLSEKTIAENVMKWGTGGLNIDGCRIGTEGGGTRCNKRDELGNCLGHPDRRGTAYGVTYHARESEGVQGRFPANVILDEEAGALLDQQSGSISYGNKPGGYSYSDRQYAVQGFIKDCKPKAPSNYGDSGGASRFFYCAKASKKERGEGNNHPTVKPVKLMEYLITLITPPNGTVLDPFFGSGTTGIAAVNLGFNYIGIELDEHYVEIARRRINAVSTRR